MRRAFVLFVAASCAWNCSGTEDAEDASTTDASQSDVVEASDAATDAKISDAPSDAPLTRDAFAQPFASSSIWNTPIGSSAVYVAANIAATTGTTLESDNDVIVLEPTAQSTAIDLNTADWSGASRCVPEGGALFSAPIPPSFVVPDPASQTPNSGLAVLLADGHTIKQTQPFARCTASTSGTSHYVFADEDLYGPGIHGAHGGSNLSAIGGTLRLGELRPNQAAPHHVLKLELFAHVDYYNDGNQADCFRWPATNCDGYFDQGALVYGGKNSSLKPGSLVALPVTTTIASLGLTTGPAAQLAWTLQNYGAYLVDDTAWSATAICTEQSPNGNFTDQFKSDWGFAIDTSGTNGAFAADMAKIIAALAVVDNNAANNVGGGGTPLQPPAPPIADE